MQRRYVLLTLIALTFVLIVGVALRYTSAADVTTTVEIQNTEPTIDSIRFATTAYGTDDLTSSGILPTLGANRTIHINGVVTDLNGKTDIASSTVSLVFHRTTKGNICTSDKNDCYKTTACTFDYGVGTATELAYNCPLDLSYWIDATDTAGAFKDDSWTAYFTIEDNAGSVASRGGTIEVNSLLALNLPDGIDYGTRSLGEQSSSTTNVETTLTQRGNTRADVFVSGGAMSCSQNGLGALSVSAQKWALSDIGYTATNTTSLTGAGTKTNRNIRLRTDDQNESAKNLYWNIAIPSSGVKGHCTGANTILITARPPVLDNESWVDTGTTLPSNLSVSQIVTVNEYLYLFGGQVSDSVVLDTIYRAPVNDPTAWVNTGAVLPSSLSMSQAISIDGYIYLFGGWNGGTQVNAIYRAPVTNPTAWVDTGAILPSNLAASEIATIGDYIYLFAGLKNSSITSVIYRAPITNPLAWEDTGATLPGNVLFSQAATIGDYVYLFGSDDTTNVIYRAPVANPTAWVDTGASLPGRLNRAELAIVGDYIYLFGGWNGIAYVNVIYRAPVVNPTAWVTTGLTLPSTLGVSQVAVLGEYVYIFGGKVGDNNFTNKIFRAMIE